MTDDQSASVSGPDREPDSSLQRYRAPSAPISAPGGYPAVPPPYQEPPTYPAAPSPYQRPDAYTPVSPTYLPPQQPFAYPGTLPFGPPMPGQFIPVAAPKGRQGWIVVAIVVGVLAFIGAAVAIVVTTKSSNRTAASHTLSVPASFSTYTLSTDQTSQLAAEDLRSEMGASSPGNADVFDQAKVGLYKPASDSVKTLVFIGISAVDAPKLRNELSNNSSASVVDGIMLGAKVPDATAYDAGPLGGTLRCGDLNVSGTDVPICAWADSSTFGMVVDGTSTSPSDTATTTLTLRSAAEH